MKTDHIPQTVVEENREHGLLWRWADIRIILALQLASALLLSVLEGENAADFLNDIFLFVLSGVVIWLAMILPSFLVRLAYRERLHWTVSVLLTVAGFVVLSMLLAIMGEKEMLKGSLALALCAVSAYKLAHSRFGLRSLGLPFSLGTASRSGSAAPDAVRQQAESHPHTEPALETPAGVTPASLPPSQPASSDHFSDCKQSSRGRTFALCLLASPLAAAIFFFSYIREDYYGDGYTTAAIMAALTVILGYWIAPRLTDAFSKSIRTYRADTPVHSIAYFIIWLAGHCVWIGISLLPLMLIRPRYCHEEMFDDTPSLWGILYMFGALMIVQYGISKQHSRAGAASNNAR